VFDRVAELEDIQHIIVSTNLKFERHFREWVHSNNQRRVEIIAENSRFEEEKPGAIASLARMVPRINDSCLLIAGDNLFTSSLKPMLRTFKEKSCVTVALYDIRDRELARLYSTATMDVDGRIIEFKEKPAHPETTLIGTCIYMLPQKTLGKLSEYLTDAGDRDAPGRFIEWLCKREPVYGHVLDGYWWDIGTIDQYHEANRTLQVDRLLTPDPSDVHSPTIRRLKDLQPVLYDAAACRDMDPEFPVYEVYRELCGDMKPDVLARYSLRYDITVMPSLVLGEEYVKTMGHDHLSLSGEWSHAEVFEVLQGKGYFLTQKYDGENVVDVSLITAQEGDVTVIPPNCGHIVINPSSKRLVVGNLVSRNCFKTYTRFMERKGAAYFVLRDNRIAKNNNYSSLPELRMQDSTVHHVEGASDLLDFLMKEGLLMHLEDPRAYSRIEENRAISPVSD
jgi:glucose-1-phosphate thymidylyltransferase